MNENKEKNFVSVVVCIGNSQNNLTCFLENVDRVLKENFDKYEIICVNDALDEEKLRTLKAYATECECGTISIINMSFRQGLEAAMNAGIDLAIGDFIFEMDTTYVDYEFTLLMEAYHRATVGYDIVSVAPKNNRNFMSTFFYCVYNAVSHTKNKLRTERFRIISRRGINRVRAINKNVPYRKPIYANCGLPMDYLLYDAVENKTLKDRRSYENPCNTAINSLILFTDIAYKISLYFAISMMLGAVLGGLYVVKVYFYGIHPVEGWTTTMMFLAFGFSAIFALFAIVIKYLSIILNLIFQKQNYLIDSIQKYGK